MCYAPDVWSSYLYAGVAARAAYWLDSRDARLANVYRNSALQAMQWAEAEMEKTKDTKYPIEVRDARNLAAIELFRLTGDAKWHDLFLATTFFKDPKAPVWEWQSHDQREAAWVYLRTNRPGLGADIKGNCLNALRREADERAVQCDKTGFRYTKNPYRPVGWACLTSPDAIGLVRVHAVTADAKYLRCAVLTCQTGAGANPVNMCYTTGLGHRSPQHPLHIDSRISHQPAPAGLTIFGPTDPDRYKDNWQQKLVAPYCYPPVLQWPPIEAYWDVFWYPEMCEFTVQAPMAENAYVWGYLAARQ
jgi:endoglucanase